MCVAAVTLVKKMDSPHLRLQLDIFHLQMITGNVTNNIIKLIPLTGTYCIVLLVHKFLLGWVLLLLLHYCL